MPCLFALCAAWTDLCLSRRQRKRRREPLFSAPLIALGGTKFKAAILEHNRLIALQPRKEVLGTPKRTSPPHGVLLPGPLHAPCLLFGAAVQLCLDLVLGHEGPVRGSGRRAAEPPLPARGGVGAAERRRPSGGPAGRLHLLLRCILF